MQRGEGGGDDDEPIPLRTLGPVRRRVYERNPKHGPVDKGRASREPKNGQDALDWSVPVKSTSRLRVGVDYGDSAFVALRFHNMGEFRDSLNYEIFHGYVLDWMELSQEQRNALMRWGLADLRGRIR
jgi:hypothetical protein